MKRLSVFATVYVFAVFCVIAIPNVRADEHEHEYDCDNEEHPEPECGEEVGSSVTPSRGEKRRYVTDLETFGNGPISFTRIYNSRTTDFTTNYVDFGWRQTWQHNWNYEVRDLQSKTHAQPDIKVRYPSGNEFNFKATDTNGFQRAPPAFHGDRLYKWSGAVVGQTLVTPDGWEYDFERTVSPRYRLVRVRNGQGLTWQLTYGAEGKLEKIENDFGRWIAIDYGLTNNTRLITGVRSSDGREVLYDYESWVNGTTNFVLTGVDYPDGSRAEYTYIGAQSETSGRALLATASDPKHPGAGSRIKLVYNYDFIFDFGGGPYLVTGVVKEERNLVTDELVVTFPEGSGQYPLILQRDGAEITRRYTNGLLIEKRDAEGRPTFYTRDQGGTGYIGSITDAESNTTTFVRDFAGRILAETDALGQTTYKSYNAAGFLTNRIDKLGRSTTYTRDENNLVTRTDYPDGSFEAWSYNQFGQTLTNRWRNGGVEVFTYYGTNEAGGLLGDLKSRTDPMGATQTYTWDSSGLLTSLADARSNIAHFVFDWRGNLLAQTNADGTALSYQYDVFGNRTNIVNELGHATTSTYDGYNRVKTVTDPLGRVTEHEYGRTPGCGCGVSVSTLARVTAPDGKMIEYAYDHSDKRTNETIAAGTAEAATTSWTYDSVGRKATQTDANGNLHTWNYDALDRVAAEINAAGDVTTYAYDAEGNLTNRVDGAGMETTWEYDAMDRIVAMGSGALRYEYEYDLGGRRTAMHTRINGNTTETTTYTYDLNNRLLTKTDPTGYALDYGYDAVGNRTNLLVTGASPASSGMVQVSYQYDPRNRLMTLTGNGRTTAFQYDALGRRTNAVWPNGTTAAYAYDEANQLLSLIHASAATTIASFVYAYDLGGNRTNMITLEGTNSYGYDNRDWLTSAIYPDGSSQEFRYDPVGNRTNLLEIHGTSSVLTAYSYGSANRLLSSASAVEVNEYAYDGAGRLTNHVVNGQPRRFAYNYRGQMTVLHDKDERIFTYDFDGDGNRISQSLNDCLETRFVYDGPDVILDLSAGGGSADGGNGSNELVHAYVNGLGIDQPIERIGFIAGQPRQRHVYHADALGSIVAMTDDAGTTVKTYTYEAFGSIRAEMQALHVNRYTFTAREAIGDSRDLMYYRYRVMSSRTGRFTSFDPLRFVDGANKYLYVVNGPLMMNDPMGLLADTGGHAVDLSPAICAGIGAARFLQMKYEDKRHGEKAGRDKWYHCVTSCQITKVCGAEFAESLGNAKERGKNPNDPDTASDQKANADGRDCGKCSKQSCVKCCEEKGYAK